MQLRNLLISFLALSLLMITAGSAVAQDGASAPEGLQDYDIDTTHSSIVFKIKHNDMGYVYGMFRGFDGSITFDEENLDESSFDFTIDATSVFTNNETRDNHLKSPDFFAAEEYPEITFTSTDIEHVNDETYRITGDLTIRGTTEEIEVMADQTGQGIDNAEQFRRGFLTTFSINRMDFGVDEMPDGLGHHVRLTFSTQAFVPEDDSDDEASEE